MSPCTVESVAVAAGSVEVVCPEPRRFTVSAAGPFRWCFSHHLDGCNLKPGIGLLDILLPKNDSSVEKDNLFREIAASPPFFSGSPPSRVSNPLTQDSQFGSPKFRPVSPIGFPIKVRGSFGSKPAVRIEGFECLDTVPTAA